MFYPKIYTLFKREETKSRNVTPIINKDYTIKALSMIKNIRVEEKIDGSNFSVSYQCNEWGEFIEYFTRRRKIDKEPKNKQDKMFVKTISEKMDFDKIKNWYVSNFFKSEGVEIKIFGEIYGSGIQTNIYLPKDERDIRIFDIKVGNSWLSPADRDMTCKEIGLKTVPKICVLNNFPLLEEAYDLLFKTYAKSIVAKENGRDEFLEGFILRPTVSLYINNNKRVIGKIKRSDFGG